MEKELERCLLKLTAAIVISALVLSPTCLAAAKKGSQAAPTEKAILQIEKDMAQLRAELGVIPEIHTDLRALRDNAETLKVTLAGVKADVDWLKQFFWVVVCTSVGSLVTSFWNRARVGKG